MQHNSSKLRSIQSFSFFKKKKTNNNKKNDPT